MYDRYQWVLYNSEEKNYYVKFRQKLKEVNFHNCFILTINYYGYLNKPKSNINFFVYIFHKLHCKNLYVINYLLYKSSV